MTIRSHLSLQRLRVEDVPQHPEFTAPAINAPALTTFLAAVFKEALAEDFETGFTNEGHWAPTGKNVKITGIDGGTSTVPVSVEQRKKGKGELTWFARRSKHAETDVRHTELDSLLMNDHSWWEYQYTPDLYDGNLLLEWDAGSLEQAVASIKQKLSIQDVEMRGKFFFSKFCLFNKKHPHGDALQEWNKSDIVCSRTNVPYTSWTATRSRFPCSRNLWKARRTIHQHADSYRLRVLHCRKHDTCKEPPGITGQRIPLQYRGQS